MPTIRSTRSATSLALASLRPACSTCICVRGRIQSVLHLQFK
jgi:hypothetical protein